MPAPMTSRPNPNTTTAATRSTVRSVAMPTEHGGWGLTLEPGLLGLLVAPSIAGVCLALAAMVAFTARTPAKIALIDLRRGRRLERTRLAMGVAAAEVAVLAGLIVAAVFSTESSFWTPLLIAGPLIAVEASFEIRSRGRRLVPELAGAVGVCAVAAMIVLADGASTGLAAGCSLVLAGRVITSIPHVRGQISRIHNRAVDATLMTVADVAAVLIAAAAIVADQRLIAGALAVAGVISIQRFAAHRPVPRPTVLGIRQMAMGFAVVLIAALGVHLF